MWPNLQIDNRALYGIARGAAIVAAIFSLVVCVLMVTNYLQLRAFDPAKNAPLDTLIAQLRQNSDNDALREQVRVLDLVSRKALFTNQWQLKTGAYLLLGGIIVLLVALKTMDSLHEKLPMPEGNLDDSESWLMSTKARRWTAGVGIALVGSSFVFAFLSYNEIGDGVGADAAGSAKDALVAGVNSWPHFRGPGGNGIARDATPPTSWDIDSGEGIAWKTAVPKPGFSSPVVCQKRVFLTGGDRDGLFIYAYDAQNGEMLWQFQVNAPDDEDFAAFRPYGDTGYAAPTMSTDGRYIFAIFGNGQLICLDLDGNEIWRKGFGIPDNHYGHSSSLLTYENLLIVQYDQASEGRLLGLDVHTGNVIWRVNREVISWSSPICVDTGERSELIVTNSLSVDSFDPKSGVRHWSIECLGGEQGPSPAFADGLLVVANESMQASGIRVGAQGAEVAWEYLDELPDAASPLVTGQYVIIPTAYGMLVCLDAQTGEMLWDHKFDDGFVASPVLLGNLIYALDMAGVMHIFEADSAYNSLGDFAIGEKSSCTPAYADGMLFIRSEKSLICIGEVQ